MAEKKSTRIMDIIITGIFLYAALLLLEYRRELDPMMLWAGVIPCGLIALFFGFRAANPDIVRGDKEE